MKAQLIPRFSTSAHTQESLGTRLLKAASESDLHHVFTTKSDTCVCGTHSGSSRVAQLHSVRMASFVLIDSTFSYNEDLYSPCDIAVFKPTVHQVKQHLDTWIAYLQVQHFQNYKTLCFVMQCRKGIVITTIAGYYLTDK